MISARNMLGELLTEKEGNGRISRRTIGKAQEKGRGKLKETERGTEETHQKAQRRMKENPEGGALRKIVERHRNITHRRMKETLRGAPQTTPTRSS